MQDRLSLEWRERATIGVSKASHEMGGVVLG